MKSATRDSVQPLMCAECGTAMNHHAEKMIDPVGSEDATQIDPILGGVVYAFHTCPTCGQSVSTYRSLT